MSNYKTYTKEKWLYFALAIAVYFVPFIVVISVYLPFVKQATGFKVALGLALVAINSIPLVMGLFKNMFIHYPMLMGLPFIAIFLMSASFFKLSVFKELSTTLCWIETAALAGIIVSTVFWAKFRKYSKYQQSVKANVHSGAFVLKEEKNG